MRETKKQVGTRLVVWLLLNTNLLSQLMHKLSVEAPPKILVERYLIEIAKNYNVPYEPDSVVMVSLCLSTEENETG
jgi:hypothetical protein